MRHTAQALNFMGNENRRQDGSCLTVADNDLSFRDRTCRCSIFVQSGQLPAGQL
jgi:hypothetical protein